MLPNNESLPLADAHEVDSLCDRFEADLASGDAPQIEQYLRGFTGSKRCALLYSLLKAEIDARSQGGDDPSIEDYQRRFPDDTEILNAAFSSVLTCIGESPTGQQSPASASSRTSDLGAEGKVLGDCRIMRSIGRGGMGEVFIAEHIRLNALRAVKILPRSKVTDASIRRFWKEAQTAARINHLNVVDIYDVGHDDDLHFIVMQYVDGHTLNEFLNRHLVRSAGEPLDAATAVSFLIRVLDALAAIHVAGLVHRDVKPGNVMVTESVGRQSHVVLMDFGLVHDASSAVDSAYGTIVGTPAYMPPEQAMGKRVDARADIYAAGATLYYLLTGRPPFEGAAMEVFHKVASSKRPPSIRALRPDLSEELCRIIERSMNPDRKARYERAVDMINALTKLSTRRKHRAPSRRPRTHRPGREPSVNSGLPGAPRSDAVTVAEASPANDTSPTPPHDPAPLESATAALSSASLTSRSFRRARRASTLRRQLERWSRTWIGKAAFATIGIAALAVFIVLMQAEEQHDEVTPAAPQIPGMPYETEPDHRDMVLIPAGTVRLGGSESQLREYAKDIDLLADDDASTDEFVAACLRDGERTVEVLEFRIDRYEVTNAEYAEFVRAENHPAPQHWNGTAPPSEISSHPVTNVSYDDAAAYAAWCGKELPTIAQWMRAYRGETDWLYPWGMQWDSSRANTAENLALPGGTDSVMASPLDRTPLGVFNMVGLVDEIVRDRRIQDGSLAVSVKGAHSGCRGRLYAIAPLEFTYVVDGPIGNLTGFRCVSVQED